MILLKIMVKPAFLGMYGFQFPLCIPNEEVVHEFQRYSVEEETFFL